MDVPASLLDFPLIQEGPPWHIGRRPLPRPRPVALPWRLVLLALVTWVPLLVLSLLHGGPTVPRAFLRDATLHVRLLVSLPILIAAVPYIQGHLVLAVRQFVIAELIDASHLPAYQDISRGVMRLRNLASVELGLLLVSFALSFVEVPFQPSLGWMREGAQGPLTLAGWWQLAVVQPLVRFVVLRWMWRSILWTVFLVRVSRLPLALVPTHPDGAGGLGFLATCQASFSVIVFALAFTLAARYWQHHADTDLAHTAKDLLSFALLSLGVLFAPLLAFCHQLALAKRRGDHAFSAVAAWHSRHFEQRWFHDKEAPGQEPLGAPEFSSLVDLGSSFTVARKMLWFPVDRRAVLAIVGAAMAPMVPILVVDRRLFEVVMALGKGLL